MGILPARQQWLRWLLVDLPPRGSRCHTDGVDQDTGLGLAAAIQALRGELVEAVAGGAEESVRFELGQVKMEFEVAVTTSVDGKAGVQFWVISAGGGAARSDVTTHRLTVDLAPVIHGRRNPLISARHGQSGVGG